MTAVDGTKKKMMTPGVDYTVSKDTPAYIKKVSVKSFEKKNFGVHRHKIISRCMVYAHLNVKFVTKWLNYIIMHILKLISVIST